MNPLVVIACTTMSGFLTSAATEGIAPDGAIRPSGSARATYSMIFIQVYNERFLQGRHNGHAEVPLEFFTKRSPREERIELCHNERYAGCIHLDQSSIATSVAAAA
jgi:hypothetical protein